MRAKIYHLSVTNYCDKRNTALTKSFGILVENTGTGSDSVIIVLTFTPLLSMLLFLPLARNNTMLLVNTWEACIETISVTKV